MALTHFSQIKGGKALVDDVEALKLSYSAQKVLTTIQKLDVDGETGLVDEQGNPVYENVNDIVIALRAAVGLAGGSGNESLADKIQNLQEKRIKDFVRVEIPVVNGAVDTENLPDFTEITGVQTTGTLPVYSANNEVLYTETGAKLTYDVATQSFNGVASALDINASKAHKVDNPETENIDESEEYVDPVYAPIADGNVKVFVKGEWMLKDLPAEALLDNNEMALAAYKDAIDQLALDLARDEDVIASVKALIGEEAVASQLEDYFKKEDIVTSIGLVTGSGENGAAAAGETLALDTKVASEKAVATALDTKFAKADIVTSIAATASALDTKVASEKAVAAAIDQVVADIEAEKVNYVVDTITIPDGNTPTSSFTITHVPTAKPVQVLVNHLIYLEGDGITVDRNSKTVTWNLTDANDGFDILKESVDKVQIIYETKEAIVVNPNPASGGSGSTTWSKNIVVDPISGLDLSEVLTAEQLADLPNGEAKADIKIYYLGNDTKDATPEIEIPFGDYGEDDSDVIAAMAAQGFTTSDSPKSKAYIEDGIFQINAVGNQRFRIEKTA